MTTAIFHCQRIKIEIIKVFVLWITTSGIFLSLDEQQMPTYKPDIWNKSLCQIIDWFKTFETKERKNQINRIVLDEPFWDGWVQLKLFHDWNIVWLVSYTFLENTFETEEHRNKITKIIILEKRFEAEKYNFNYSMVGLFFLLVSQTFCKIFLKGRNTEINYSTVTVVSLVSHTFSEKAVPEDSWNAKIS